MNLSALAETIETAHFSPVQLITGRCLHSRSQFAGCTACTGICPEGAIQPGKPPVLNAAACKGCMACVPACPAGAFQADDAASNLYASAARINGPALELICRLHPAPQTGLKGMTALQTKTCLAALGPGVYVGLSALGFTDIRLRVDACAKCRWHALKERICEQVKAAGGLLAAWHPAGCGSKAAFACVERLDTPVERPLMQANAPLLSRRDLFRMASRESQSTLVSALNPAERDGQVIQRDRLRLLAAVEHLPSPQSPEQASLRGLNFATLAVSDDCTACGACARTCPTGALIFERDTEKTRFTLAFDPLLCTGCELCTRACAPDALRVTSAVEFTAVFGRRSVVLQSGELVKCMRCGARMVKRGNAQRCPICEMRAKNPFKVVKMPGSHPPR